jgi:peroxiredoxin Q/BCP
MRLLQLTLLTWLLVTSMTSAAELQVGDIAPAFDLPGSDGTRHTLAQHHGQQYVVIAFFPKAHTGG